MTQKFIESKKYLCLGGEKAESMSWPLIEDEPLLCLANKLNIEHGF